MLLTFGRFDHYCGYWGHLHRFEAFLNFISTLSIMRTFATSNDGFSWLYLHYYGGNSATIMAFHRLLGAFRPLLRLLGPFTSLWGLFRVVSHHLMTFAHRVMVFFGNYPGTKDRLFIAFWLFCYCYVTKLHWGPSRFLRDKGIVTILCTLALVFLGTSAIGVQFYYFGTGCTHETSSFLLYCSHYGSDTLRQFVPWGLLTITTKLFRLWEHSVLLRVYYFY